MKALVTLILAAATTWTATAQDSTATATATATAELEARVAILERQNLSLKAALEAISGRSLAEILAAAPPATQAPAAPPAQAELAPAGPTPEQLAAMESVRQQIAEIEAVYFSRDPFAGSPGPFAHERDSKIKTSRADRERKERADMEQLARLRDQLARMEAAVAAAGN